MNTALLYNVQIEIADIVFVVLDSFVAVEHELYCSQKPYIV
jgi:hypothetical protein